MSQPKNESNHSNVDDSGNTEIADNLIEDGEAGAAMVADPLDGTFPDDTKSMSPAKSGDTTESAWERWEMPFFLEGDSASIRGRSVSDALEAMTQAADDAASLDEKMNDVSNQENLFSLDPFSAQSGSSNLNSKDEAEQAMIEALEEAKARGYQEGLELGRAEGYEHGLSEGRAEGQALGKQAFDEEAAHWMDKMMAVMSELNSRIVERDEVLLERVMQVVRQLVEYILRYELSFQPEALKSLVNDVLNGLDADQATIQVSVHPDTRSEFESLLTPEAYQRVSWNCDEKLAPGTIRAHANSTTRAFDVDQVVNKAWQQWRSTIE